MQYLLQHMTGMLMFKVIHSVLKLYICIYEIKFIFLLYSQTLEAVSATTLNGLKSNATDYSVIGIDEGQFVSF